MIALIQRVSKAKIKVDKLVFSKIDKGFLIFLGVHKEDTREDAKYLSNKVQKARIFPDSKRKMNLSIKEINGSVLVVSQFTLYGDCTHGNRPSFINSAKPQYAETLYNLFIEKLKEYQINVQTGKFGAEMDVHLCNNGPVTIIINSKNE